MTLLLFLGTAAVLLHSGHLIPDFCRLPKHEGEGTAFGFAVHYDHTLDVCFPFLYKGQGGNQNRFSNERECIRNCSANAEKIYPLNVVEACHFPKAVGNCSGRMTRFYYDSVNDRCRRFQFSGCFGNGNRFADFNSCNATCDGVHDDDREEDPNEEGDTPVAIICGVLLSLVVLGIVVTIVVLTVKSKKKEAKKKGAKSRQQDVPLQEATVEVS